MLFGVHLCSAFVILSLYSDLCLGIHDLSRHIRVSTYAVFVIVCLHRDARVKAMITFEVKHICVCVPVQIYEKHTLHE